MKEMKSRFKHLDLTSKEKKNSIRAQAFERIVAAVAAVKKYERARRKSRLSIDSADSENITMSTSTIKNSILQKIDEVLNAQNVNINQIVERMNIMKTILTKLTTISLRIEVKLNQNERSDRHHTKKRANSREFEHFVDSQSFKNDQSTKYSKKKIIINFSKEKRFKTVDVEYFDSHLLDFYDKRNVITSNDKTIYRDVFLFIEVVKFIADLVKYHATRIRLHRCLRDAVLKWYRDELKQEHRDALKRDEYLNKWNKKITTRFKIDESEILNLLTKNKYTVENVRSKRFVDVYVQQVIRHARSAGFIMISNQLNWAWMNIVVSLQRDINKSHADMTIIDFIKALKEKQYSWRNFYKMKLSQTQIKKRWEPQSLFIQNQYDNRQIDYSSQQITDYRQRDFYVNNSSFNYRNDRRNNQFRYDNNARNDRNYDQDYNRASNQAQSQFQQRLLKTPLFKQSSWTHSLQRVSTLSISMNLQRAYFINQKKKKQYQNSKNVYHEQKSEDISLESFQQQKPRSAIMNSYFNEHEKSRYDLALYICDHDHKLYSFDNVDELREHVLEYHGVDTRFNISKMQIRDTNHVRHAAKHVYNYASSNSFGYITIQVEVFDTELSSCVDFEETVNLLNRTVLLKDNLYDIVHNALSITITDVADRQIFSQVVKIDVELSFNKVSLQMTAYLVKNLSSDLIIVNDVLNRFDVDFQHDNNIIKIDDIEVSLFYNNADSTSYHYTITSTRLDQHTSKTTIKWRSNIISRVNSFKTDAFISCLNSTPTESASVNQRSSSSQYQLKCRRCKQIFDFNNQLHSHLINCRTREIVKSARRRNFTDSWKF